MKSYQKIPSTFLDIASTEALVPSTDIYSGELSANIEQTLSVPTGADFVLFNADNDFYVNYDLTATVPSGPISQVGGELNPIVRNVTEITTLHFISAAVTKLSVVFYGK